MHNGDVPRDLFRVLWRIYELSVTERHSGEVTLRLEAGHPKGFKTTHSPPLGELPYPPVWFEGTFQKNTLPGSGSPV